MLCLKDYVMVSRVCILAPSSRLSLQCKIKCSCFIIIINITTTIAKSSGCCPLAQIFKDRLHQGEAAEVKPFSLPQPCFFQLMELPHCSFQGPHACQMPGFLVDPVNKRQSLFHATCLFPMEASVVSVSAQAFHR